MKIVYTKRNRAVSEASVSREGLINYFSLDFSDEDVEKIMDKNNFREFILLLHLRICYEKVKALIEES
jgi:hypothetical protein